jgi:hypothetical protein
MLSFRADKTFNLSALMLTPLPARAIEVQKNRRSVELSLREIAQKLMPGMPADVLIITERTAYFLGPIS